LRDGPHFQSGSSLIDADHSARLFWDYVQKLDHAPGCVQSAEPGERLEHPGQMIDALAFTQYAVLIFPNQHLSQDQHLDFAKHFGSLETTIGVYRKDAPLRLRKEFADVSNLNHDNEVWGKESRLRLSNWPTGSGTPIARSSAYQHRCFMRVRYRQSADIRNLPMSARPTMRFPRR
jgi:hypothetical protein